MKFLITLLFLPFSLFAQQEKSNNSFSFSTGTLTQFGSYSQFYKRGSSFQFNWVHDINPVISYGFGVVTGNNNINAQEVKRYVRQYDYNYFGGEEDELEDRGMTYSAVYASLVLNASLKKWRLFMPVKVGYGLYTSTGYLYRKQIIGWGSLGYEGVYEKEYAIPTGYKSIGIGLSYPVVKNVVANVLCEFSHALVNVYLEDDINNRGVYYGERYSKDISNWLLGVGVEVKFGVGKK